MELFDSHCHIQSSTKQTAEDGEAATHRLWSKAGYPTTQEIIGRATDKDVTRMTVVGCNLQDSRLAITCTAGHDNLYASIGIHPHEAQSHDTAKLEQFAELATEPKVVAIGECGLDYFYEHSPPEAQKRGLKFQIELALRHDLPMIFHVRQALDDFWPIYDSYQTPIRGVLHSFTDTAENLEQAMKRGLYIGVNGISTFAKDPRQLDMYRQIPLEKLLLETDSPFLTPSPYRGTICEPYHISVIANFLAELREEPLDELARTTTVNARTLFNV